MIRYRMISLRPALFPLRLLGGLCAGALLLLAQPHSASPRAGLTRAMRRRWPAFPSARAPGPSIYRTISLPPRPPAAPPGCSRRSPAAPVPAPRRAASSMARWWRQIISPAPRHRRKPKTIQMILSGGNIREFAIEPEPPVDPERLPVTDANRRGVFDPMTGSMLRVPGSGDPLNPDAAAPARRFSTAACATISSSTTSGWKR